MTERTIVPGWTVTSYEGEFEPMAFGPNNVSVDVNDDDTVTIEHDVRTGYHGGTSTERVTVPIRWLTEFIAETLAYRAQKANR